MTLQQRGTCLGLCCAFTAVVSIGWGFGSDAEPPAKQDPERAQRSPAVAAAVESAEALLAEAEEKEKAKDLDAARVLVRKAVEALAGASPPDSDADAIALYERLGGVARRIGELKSAHKARQAVYESRRRTLPEDHADLQKARAGLAITIRELGDLKGARALEEKVLDVCSRTLPDGDPDLQAARQNLAGTIFQLGDVKGAHALFEKVLEVRSRTLPEDHPDLQAARMNLALTMRLLGDLKGARALLEKVLEAWSRTLPDDHADLQKARQNLAGTILQLGDVKGAHALFEKVLEIRSRTLPDDHPDLQWARGNLAITIRNLGDPKGARALQEKVLEVRSRTLPDDHPDLQTARGNLAVTMRDLGDLKGARALTEKVLEVWSRTLPDGHPHLQAARLNLAVTMGDLGDLKGARALEEKILEVRSRTLPDDHPDLQTARGNLAGTMFRLGDLKGAQALHEKVLEVRSRTLPDDHPDLQMARGNLAITIRNLGDLKGARGLEEKVLEVWRRTLPDDHPDLQKARQNLAITMSELGDLKGARALQEKVLEIYSRTLSDDHPDLQTARLNLSFTATSMKDDTTARSLAAKLARSARAAPATIGASLSPRELECFVIQRQEELSCALSIARGAGIFAPDPALDRDAFSSSESLRAIAARLQRSLRRAAALAAAGDPEVARLTKGLEEKAGALAQLALRPDDAAGGAQEIARLARERDALLSSLRSHLEKTAAKVTLGEVTLDGVAGALAKDQAAVSYLTYERAEIDPEKPGTFKTEESLLAFVVRPDGSLARVELGPLAAAEEAIEAWRDLIGAPLERGAGRLAPAEEALTKAGVRIRTLVFDPIRAAIGDARTLVTVLDGGLQLVPLDALPEGDGFLGDRYAIHVRNALAEILDRVPPELHAPSLVALGGADYDRAQTGAESQGGEFRSGPRDRAFVLLPETEEEAKTTAAYFRVTFEKEPILLAGARATSDLFRALAPRARFLHLATHGYFAPESMRSIADPRPVDRLTGLGSRMTAGEAAIGLAPSVLCGLAFAGANSEPDALGRVPGILTAEELGETDLSRCELAVLSACDTHVGIRRAGQGIASLQQALYSAGAQTAISSLWKVPDQATRELMADFYRRIWRQKKPKAQALWESKVALRSRRDDSGRLRYGIRDWAGWVLTGDPR